MSSALPSPEHKRAFVQSMFDRIAPHYDRMNRLMTLGMDLRWRRRGFERLSLRVGELVIDLATGTGDFAALASRFGAHSVGVDLALGMLREARRTRPELSIAQGDGVALPFRSGCAAAVTCGFALRNFSDLPAVLAECARVLRPGGQLLVLEVDQPRFAPLRAAHALHFRHLVPKLGAWLSDSAAYRYLPESAAFLPDADTLREHFIEAGFAAPRKYAHALGAVQCLIAERESAKPA